MKITVNQKTDFFQEGDLVISQDGERVYLVTVPATGHDSKQEDDVFWAICLTGNRCSGGNYRKDLFVPFRGTIVIEA